jgi:hypothetical protein
MQGVVLYKTIVVLNRLKTDNITVRSKLDHLLTKLADKYATPEKFIEFNK